MEFSKWNKRITIWLLLIAGFYMGIMQYPIEYTILFLATGLSAMGITIWSDVQKSIKFTGNPPEEDEEDTAG